MNFGTPSGSLGASFFHQDCVLDPYFSMSVFVMVPGGVFNGFWMLLVCPGIGRTMQNHWRVIQNQVLSKFDVRGSPGPSGTHFSLIFGPPLGNIFGRFFIKNQEKLDTETILYRSLIFLCFLLVFVCF